MRLGLAAPVHGCTSLVGVGMPTTARTATFVLQHLSRMWYRNLRHP